MNKYLHCFGHCELWFELNSWVKGNRSNVCDCSDCVVCQITRGWGVGGEKRSKLQCMMWLNLKTWKYT